MTASSELRIFSRNSGLLGDVRGVDLLSWAGGVLPGNLDDGHVE